MGIEDIKKALKQCCSFGLCDGCPYTHVEDCQRQLKHDALKAIMLLEANAENG